MKEKRNLTWEKKFAKVGVTMRYPAPKTRPHVYELKHECGAAWTVEYLKLSREERPEYWRCPKGCHRGVKLK